MASAISKDSDVHVTFEDQQYINTFARCNAKMQELKDEIEAKKKELQNLEDACDELLMSDTESRVPYMIGEVFMMCSVDDTNSMLEDAKNNITSDMNDMEQKSEGLKKTLGELKAKLYAKFGTNINLEMEEES